MRRILLSAVLVAVAAPAPSGGVHRASCRPTAVWRGWSMGSGSSSPTTTGASPIGAWRRGTTPGLDWQDGQVVSVQLVQAAIPVPALPVAGAVLLVLVLLVRGW